MPYTVEQIRTIINSLFEVFDKARLVDPFQHKIVTIDEDGQLVFNDYMCYQVWNKQSVCKNCISVRALQGTSRMTKFEFVNREIYQVIAKPVEIFFDGKVLHFSLEIISKITDEIFFETFGKNQIIQKIVENEKKIFTDSLTEVYNRRYFDEKIFCHTNVCALNKNIVFIMVDFKKFKLINDNYGHDVGDWVLIHAAKVFQKCVRDTDSVIRLGGDEFLLILCNAQVAIAEKMIENIKESLKKEVIYDLENNKYAIANFGIAYAETFNQQSDLISDLLKQADENMYIDKNSNEALNF